MAWTDPSLLDLPDLVPPVYEYGDHLSQED
jgi:hypothetical protein